MWRKSAALFFILYFFSTSFLVFSQEERGRSGEVLDLYAGIPILDRGRSDGVQTGDEYQIVSGEKSIGRAVVKRSDRAVSELTLLYSREEIEEGMPLRYTPLLGFNVSWYIRYTHASMGNVILESEGDGGEHRYSAGAVLSWRRGFYSFRPLLGLEYPFAPERRKEAAGFPLRVYAGGELLWYIGRLQVAPSLALGTAFLFPSAERSSTLSHYGGIARLSFSYLITGRIRLYLEFGGVTWKAVPDEAVDDIGPFAGLGMSLRG